MTTLSSPCWKYYVFAYTNPFHGVKALQTAPHALGFHCALRVTSGYVQKQTLLLVKSRHSGPGEKQRVGVFDT